MQGLKCIQRETNVAEPKMTSVIDVISRLVYDWYGKAIQYLKCLQSFPSPSLVVFPIALPLPVVHLAVAAMAISTQPTSPQILHLDHPHLDRRLESPWPFRVRVRAPLGHS